MYLEERGFWIERIAANEVGLEAAQKSDDRQMEQKFSANLGYTYFILDEQDRAIDYIRQSLIIAQEIGDLGRTRGRF